MIQINNLSEKITQHQPKILSAIERVIRSGWVILGPEVKQFETSFATYLNINHCIGLANGTDAIEFALKAAGVQTGNRVATVANAGMYTTTALEAIGAEPLYIDVDIDTHNTTLTEVKNAIKMGAQAVVITHLYGRAVPEITQIADYCAQHNVKLIEDCAQAHGAEIDGKRVGTFGNCASFSFYPTKNLGALGDAGAVVTNDAQIAENTFRLRQYGWSKKYHTDLSGARNSRLDEIQAAILSELLPLLDETNARRREIATRYSTEINHAQIQTPNIIAGKEYVAHLYVIRSPGRDTLRAHLQAQNIASEIHYPIPDYRQVVFGQRFSNVSLKNTEQLAGEILTLPCYPEMTHQQIDTVIKAVNEWRI